MKVNNLIALVVLSARKQPQPSAQLPLLPVVHLYRSVGGEK
ncbi:hypothetical protein [Chitinophaga sp. CF418]|nr:hypothetical protein [Chitinophaga sp. CF418]SHN30498.1 hypothetical protein SAMN05216311_108321 [Chitinophaga sp. CF418]